MLASRMLALLPLLMMVGGVGAPADPGSPDPYEDWEAGWDGAQVRAPAAKKQKTPDQAGADAFAAWEVVEEGAPGAAAPSGVYDVEMENILRFWRGARRWGSTRPRPRLQELERGWRS